MHLVALSAALILQSTPLQSAPRSKGLYLGPVQLCRDALVSAAWQHEGEPKIALQMPAKASEPLQRFTKANVGSAMRVTLNGRLLQSVVVPEPLTSSTVRVSATIEQAAEILASVSKTTCN